MTEVLFVSKPIEPPWNDSSKNLTRDVATSLRRHRPAVMVREGAVEPFASARCAPVYRAGGASSFSPSLRDRLDVLRYLLWDAQAGLWHFFFAPNRRSSAAGRLAASLRRAASVHTVCSMPPESAPLKSLVFADITVALSRASYDRFVAEGLSRESVRLIPPSVPKLSEVSPEERNRLRARHGLPRSVPVWLFPGDLEHGGGAEISLAAMAASRERDAVLVMACREKTPRAASARAELVEQAKRFGVDDRIRWVGETEDILELVASSDFVLMPNRSPFAKMDYPLVVLEAMSMARPVFVSAGTPAAELAEEGGAIAVVPDGEALAATIQEWSNDRLALEELQRRARALTIEKFAPAKVAASYEQIYDELHD